MSQGETKEVHPTFFGKRAEMMEILVIDDEPGICVVIGEILSPAGYQVREAYDGDKGIALCRAQRTHPPRTAAGR